MQDNNIDAIFPIGGLVLSHISPYLSMILGALLYHIYMKNKIKKSLNYREVIFIIFTAGSVSYYSYPIELEYIPVEIIPSLNFTIGIFGRDIINYIIQHKLINKILDKFFKMKK